MSAWTTRALCRTRPADWWETGDEGNRLAVTLCRVACPVRDRCSAADPAPHGVVRAGVAFLDTGHPADVCGCGRPVSPARVASTSCRACDPPYNTPMPAPRRGTRLPAGGAERHLDAIAALLVAGWTYRAIGARLGGIRSETVRGVARRHGLVSCAPQAGPRRGEQQRKGRAA